jgi:hypothetical protein
MNLIRIDCPSDGRKLPVNFTATGLYLTESADGVEVICRLVYPNGDLREVTADRKNTNLKPVPMTLQPAWSCPFVDVPLGDGVLLRAILLVDGDEKSANVVYNLTIAAVGGTDCP